MRRDPESATSKTYELKMAMLENRKPEEFLSMMNNFKTEIYGTGTTIISGKNKLPAYPTMLRSPPIIQRAGKPSHGHNKRPSNVH